MESLGESNNSMQDNLYEQRYKRIQASMAKANKKYRENNKEIVNKIAKDYYNRHKDDEAWREKQREKAKKAYYKKKEKLHQENTLVVI